MNDMYNEREEQFGENQNVDSVLQNNEESTVENIGDNKSSNKKLSKKKTVILAISLIVVIAVAFAFLYTPKFERVKRDCLDIVGVLKGTDEYFILDTKDDSTVAKMIGVPEEEVLEAIKYANEQLGFNDSVYAKMLETSALMGRQSEENDKYKVSWTYHPDDGLEVTYEKK